MSRFNPSLTLVLLYSSSFLVHVCLFWAIIPGLFPYVKILWLFTHKVLFQMFKSCSYTFTFVLLLLLYLYFNSRGTIKCFFHHWKSVSLKHLFGGSQLVWPNFFLNLPYCDPNSTAPKFSKLFYSQLCCTSISWIRPSISLSPKCQKIVTFFNHKKWKL